MPEGERERKELAEVILACYPGAPLCRGGVRFSDAAQRCITGVLRGAYGSGYSGSQHHEVSESDLRAFRRSGSSYGSETYGELLPEGFIDLLWQIGARPGDRFYDLGSGTGKLAVLAWLAGLRSSGVELSESRWSVSKGALESLSAAGAEGRMPAGGQGCVSGLPSRRTCGLDCVWGDLLEVDFTDADVLFMSSVMFTKGMVAKVARVARWMKPGAKIVSFHNLSDLGASAGFSEFELLGEVLEPTSWRLATCFQVMTVVGAPPQSDVRPSNLRRVENFDADHRCACAC